MTNKNEFDYTKLSRNYKTNPLKIAHHNVLEDIPYEDLLYLTETSYFKEAREILGCGEKPLYRQLKAHGLKFKKHRKNGIHTKEEKEVLKYGKLGLTRREKLEITAQKTDFRKKSAEKNRVIWKERIKREGGDAKRQEKIKATKARKYGNPNYNNRAKIDKTNEERYGVKTLLMTKESLSKSHSPEALVKSTTKRLKTWKNKPDEEKRQQYIKAKNTINRLYGPKGATSNEKWLAEHPDFRQWTGSEEHLARMNEIQEKRYWTLKRNKTFNASKSEKQLYDLLLKRFTIVEQQYSSEVYPYACDYYLPDYNTYIELQGFPSHGDHPFNPTDPADIEKLEQWKQKSAEINWKGERKAQYDNYIEVWTQSDPEKRECAKRNKLNFLEIFPQDFDYDLDAIMEYIWNFTLQLNANGLS